MTSSSHRRLRAATTVLAVTAVALGLATATPAQAEPAPSSFQAVNDYCLGQCNDVMPPGENGNANIVDIIGNRLLKTQPPHTSDQLGKYDQLLYGYSNLTNSQISSFFNDSSFGVPPDQVESVIKPRADVTIVRDKAAGIPHITGTTRSGTEFGAGFAAGQDRLWLMDVLRHVGRAQLSSFAGGAEANRTQEQSQWAQAPYTEADLQRQVEAIKKKGSRGEQAYEDVINYLKGINAYIAQAKGLLTQPGEYALTGNADLFTGEGIRDFTPTDVVAIASMVGAIFGSGGGMELQSALVKQAAIAQYGAEEGAALWASLREQNDPEATTTIHNGKSFPYGQTPAHPAGVAMPDADTLRTQPVVENPSGSAGQPGAATGAVPAATFDKPKPGMSNALIVSGKHTDDGHPVAVFGPQTGYYAPQLLMLQELQGPGISSRGAAFAGISFYTLLGRGQDYSWSATSAGQDIVDTYAVTLCNPQGGAIDPNATFYEYHGKCTPMERLATSNSWHPTLADQTPAGSYDLVTYRTKYGLVTARATVDKTPVAYTKLRSTYMHEADSIIGFQEFNDPDFMKSATDFQHAASDIGYTFNWFYVDSRDTAYYNSGTNPVRKSTMDPNLPALASTDTEWQGFNADAYTSDVTGFTAHPNSQNQDYYVSWNNKQAKDYSAADGNFAYGSIHRAKLLDERVKAMVDSPVKVTRASLTQAMEQAASADLRGEYVLPELLKVIGSAPVTDLTQATAVRQLTDWVNTGAYLQPTSPTSKQYLNADAIRLLDAWWPLLAQAEFGGTSGMNPTLLTALANTLPVDESPTGVKHRGSAFQHGWWSYVDKDIRAVLGQSVQDPLPQKFCGSGDPAACRTALLTSLGAAAKVPATTVYPADKYCAAGDQWCSDSVVQSPFGGVKDDNITWQNRPTFQQVVQYPAHRSDTIANLALGKPATASSSQVPLFGFLGPDLPAALATDGDPNTRWASGAWADNESITVDLGSSQTVARAVLRWEVAYGKGYQIQVSDNGTNYRSVYATNTGQPGVNSVSFAPTTARYVRMQGEQRGTWFGYSLYEFEVYSR
ncbi:MAG: penicillin acylase family protein [Mycobacteriaceae bacterium]